MPARCHLYTVRVFGLTAILLWLGLSPVRAGPDQTMANRQAFLAAVALLETDPAGHDARRRSLDDYLLTPYLDHARLKRDLPTVSTGEARRFLESEATTQLGNQFRREFLAELGRRADWPSFAALDSADPGLSTGLRCQRVQALLGTGRTDDARQEFLAIWPTGNSLPAECDDPLTQARARGWLGSAVIWQRLRLAVDTGNPGLAGTLARLLPESERADGQRLAQAAADPQATLKAAASWPDLPPEWEAAGLALRRLARTDVDSAIGHWALLAPRFAFGQADRAAILHDLALYAAVAYRPDAEEWFERVPVEFRSEQLVDWQLRAALAGEGWDTVLKVVDGMPGSLAAASRPRYWRARALAEVQREAEARTAYATLATEATFHGFLAADRLNAPYVICPRQIGADAERAAALRSQRDIARALELYAIGWRVEAARAWDYARESLSEADRRQMLLLASEQGWHDRVVFGLSSGDDLRQYVLRFPLAERETVERESARNGLDPAWAFALIRAESAWQPDVRSPANAYGLMQLLPATGQQMARQLGLSWPGTSMLLDPQTNIRLGTRYLAQQAERFQGSPWLASAAYNAGPAPVQRWLGDRGTLPADIFIETIPYRETRDYVMRVLAFSVIYDWRMNGSARPLSDRLPDPGRRYTGATRAAPVRPVVCPGATGPAATRGASSSRPQYPGVRAT